MNSDIDNRLTKLEKELDQQIDHDYSVMLKRFNNWYENKIK